MSSTKSTRFAERLGKGRPGQMARDLRTARHLSLSQLYHRTRFLGLRRLYARLPAAPLALAARRARGLQAARFLPAVATSILAPEGLAAVKARAARYAAGRFVYLGREADYSAGIQWRDPSASPLWQYQLQYLGSVLDLVMAGNLPEARSVLTSWRTRHESRWDPVAWHPYPVSLRLANLCHAAGLAGSFDALGDGVERLCAIHAAYLASHLERDVRGNHLLENARALRIASHFFVSPGPGNGLAERAAKLARSIERSELAEQTLADGGHFERSAMYHVIVLHRVLESVACAPGDPALHEHAPIARRMAAWLGQILCPDGDIPLLGDSAREFAPPAGKLLELAQEILPDLALPRPRDGALLWRESGVAVLRGPDTWALFDVGPVCPLYLPAHGQADTLSLEIWLRGACIATDPGLCEYTGPERAWGRSSRAHSTITVDDRDNSEVYGSFRVGGRAELGAVEAGEDWVAGELRPFGQDALLRRRVALLPGGGLRIEDQARIPAGHTARSRLHLHPTAAIVARQDGGRTLVLQTPAGPARIRSASPLRTEPGRRSPRFGAIEPTTIVVQDLAYREPVARGWLEVVPEASYHPGDHPRPP